MCGRCLIAALLKPACALLSGSGAVLGGGAAGDSTFILRQVLDRGLDDVAMGPLWDPIAVRLAFEAGVGARLSLRLGGKTSPLSGDPVDAVCTIRALHQDMVMTGLGLDPALSRIVVLKSSQHFRAAFAAMAAAVICVDAPGSVRADLKSLTYRKARQDLWPLAACGTG